MSSRNNYFEVIKGRYKLIDERNKEFYGGKNNGKK